MREILFRGRSMAQGSEWLYGDVLLYENSAQIWETIDGRKHNSVVSIKTIGQYTGLRDCKRTEEYPEGQMIFEGDILKIARVSDCTGSYYYPPLNYPVNVVVKWDLCAWMWETLCEDKRYIGFPDAWCHYECEVIGNIHDNPELLKGGAE